MFTTEGLEDNFSFQLCFFFQVGLANPGVCLHPVCLLVFLALLDFSCSDVAMFPDFGN